MGPPSERRRRKLVALEFPRHSRNRRCGSKQVPKTNDQDDSRITSRSTVACENPLVDSDRNTSDAGVQNSPAKALSTTSDEILSSPATCLLSELGGEPVTNFGGRNDELKSLESILSGKLSRRSRSKIKAKMSELRRNRTVGISTPVAGTPLQSSLTKSENSSEESHSENTDPCTGLLMSTPRKLMANDDVALQKVVLRLNKIPGSSNVPLGSVGQTESTHFGCSGSAFEYGITVDLSQITL